MATAELDQQAWTTLKVSKSKKTGSEQNQLITSIVSGAWVGNSFKKLWCWLILAGECFLKGAPVSGFFEWN